jgi:hypothetical protein
MHPSIVALLPKLKRQADLGRHFFNVRFRDPQQGGYVHDTAVSVMIPPRACVFNVGTWTDTAGAVAGTYCVTKTGAANSPFVAIPLMPLQNSVALKGSYLKSIDVWWILGTAALTTLTATIRQNTAPANAAAYPASVTPAFTYDSNHLNNAARVTVAQHTMTLTVTTPFWLANTEQDILELTLVDPGTSVFNFYGARANYTLRM